MLFSHLCPCITSYLRLAGRLGTTFDASLEHDISYKSLNIAFPSIILVITEFGGEASILPPKLDGNVRGEHIHTGMGTSGWVWTRRLG